MDRLIIEKYIRDNKRVSIPEIQFKFSLTYKETRMLFQELENKKVIKPEDDIYYTVLSQAQVLSSRDDDHDSQEDDDTVRLERRAREDARRREEIRKRREELRRRMTESHFFDDDEEDEEDDEDDEDDEDYYDKEESEKWVFDDNKDDDDDEDEKTIDEIRREVLKKISATEEQSEDAEDEEEADDDDTALREPIEITVEDIEKRRTLAKIATSFGCSGEFTRVGEEYYCTLGVVYPNDVPMTFKLSYKDKIILSDYGLTHKYISTYFDLADSNIQELIEKIMQEYNLTWITEGQMKELSIQIRDQGGAFISFLYFFSAIERISNISPEKWYKIASEKEDSFCKEETFKILFEQKATYEEAIQTAKNLYMQSQTEGDEFKKHAYKTIVEMFEGIGAEDFEYFKQRLLEGEEE